MSMESLAVYTFSSYVMIYLFALSNNCCQWIPITNVGKFLWLGN